MQTAFPSIPRPKKCRGTRRLHGFTRVEAVVVVVMVAMIGCLLLSSSSKAKMRSNRIFCAANLKQFGTGLRLFSNNQSPEHGRFAGKGGPALAWTNSAFSIPSEFADAKGWICPSDSARVNFLKTNAPAGLSTNLNGFVGPANLENLLGYFYGVLSDETSPATLLGGDRNLTAGQARSPDGPDVSPMWSYGGKGPVSLGGGLSSPLEPNCGWN